MLKEEHENMLKVESNSTVKQKNLIISLCYAFNFSKFPFSFGDKLSKAEKTMYYNKKIQDAGFLF